MPTGYEFDQDKALQAFNRLSEVAERMQAARKRLKTVGPKTLGTDGLDNACDTFQSAWDDGITRIEKAASGMSSRLDATIKSYGTTEDETAKSLGAGRT